MSAWTSVFLDTSLAPPNLMASGKMVCTRHFNWDEEQSFPACSYLELTTLLTELVHYSYSDQWLFIYSVFLLRTQVSTKSSKHRRALDTRFRKVIAPFVWYRNMYWQGKERNLASCSGSTAQRSNKGSSGLVGWLFLNGRHLLWICISHCMCYNHALSDHFRPFTAPFRLQPALRPSHPTQHTVASG
jgi:hypothetical protein